MCVCVFETWSPFGSLFCFLFVCLFCLFVFCPVLLELGGKIIFACAIVLPAGPCLMKAAAFHVHLQPGEWVS